MAEYDAFQAAVQQKIGRPLTQQELDNNEFLYGLPNDLITLLPAGRLETFSSERLMSLDNADLYALVLHNPNIANQMPAYRFTGGGQYGGFSSTQLQQVLTKAGEMGIQGPGMQEIQAAVSRVTGQPAPGGGTAPPGTAPPATKPPGDTTTPGGGGQPAPSLAREQWEAELANQPGNVYEWLFRSRGMEPVGGSRQIGGPTAGLAPGTGGPGTTMAPSLGPAASSIPAAGQSGFGPASGGPTGKVAGVGSDFTTQGASKPPGYGEAGNPWANAGSQIVNQQRPNFNELRGQVQDVGGDIPPGVLNPILGLSTPSYTTQGGMPLLAPQTAARMSPAERALWDVTVNRTGGRADDDRYQSQRLGRLGGNVPTVEYTGVSRTPGARR